MLRRLFAAVAIACACAVPLRAFADATQNCAINTGLDPACPLTAAGASETTTVRTGTATAHADTAFGSLALGGDEQLDLSLPFYDHLGIAGVGNAYGMGDVGAGFSRVVARRKRIAQVIGLFATFPSGAIDFSTGRTELAPSYAASYALGGRISLVAIASYRFPVGGTNLPYAPRVQRFDFVPRVIADLSKRGLFAAAGIDGANVTGDERFQEYSADGVIGVATPRYALSLTYREPIAFYTWHHVYEHALTWSLSWRP